MGCVHLGVNRVVWGSGLTTQLAHVHRLPPRAFLCLLLKVCFCARLGLS